VGGDRTAQATIAGLSEAHFAVSADEKICLTVGAAIGH
jgi:hypothetical protein